MDDLSRRSVAPGIVHVPRAVDIRTARDVSLFLALPSPGNLMMCENFYIKNLTCLSPSHSLSRTRDGLQWIK